MPPGLERIRRVYRTTEEDGGKLAYRVEFGRAVVKE
jgi:hypothetical protein